jgi:hypothetical protein
MAGSVVSGDPDEKTAAAETAVAPAGLQATGYRLQGEVFLKSEA